MLGAPLLLEPAQLFQGAQSPLLLLLSGIALQLVSPLILRYFIDTTRAGGSQTALMMAALLLMAALLFIGSALVQQALSVSATYFSENVAWTATNGLRRDLAAHCLALEMSFHNSHTPGELIERIDGDVTLLANFFSEFVIQVLGSALLVVGVLIMLFRLDWRIGLALVAFTALVMGLLVRLRGLATPHWIAGREATADLAGFLEERLAGTEDIRSSRATDFVMRQFYTLMRSIMLAFRQAHVMGSVSLGLARVGFTAGLAIGLAVGAFLYLRGEVTIGTVFLTAYYSGILSFPLATITDQIDDLQQATAGVARIAALRVVTYRGRHYAATALLALLMFAAPVVVGLLEKAVFDALTHQARAEPGIWTLLALMVALEVSAYLLNVVRWLTDAQLRFGAIALLRKNMLLHVLRQPGRGSRADRSSGRPPPACSCGTPSCW